MFSISAISSSILAFKVSFLFCPSSNFWLSDVSWSFKICKSSTICSSFSLYVFMLYTNSPTSMLLSSSLKSKNFLALSACNFKGSNCPSISDKISFIRNRLSFVCSSFFSDSTLRVLYFTIPAASSNMCLLSSDLLLKISSILPCPIIEYPSFPIPVSINNSIISLSLHGVLFIK